MKVIALCLLVLSFCCVSFEVQCPPSEDLFPCSCREVPPTLTCSGNKIFNHELKVVAQQINESKLEFNTIYIDNTRVTHLENNTFPKGKYSYIFIGHNINLQYIDSHAFSGSVKDFEFINNPNLKGDIFPVLKSLNITNSIKLTGNIIHEIPANAFNSHANKIYLSSNSIKKIGSNGFSSLPNLQILGLDHNLIDNLDSDSLNFSSNKFQKFINLNDNKLIAKSFADNFLPKLKGDSISIHFEDNKIEYLSENIFRPFMEENGHKLYFDRNPFKCNCSMKWIIDEPQSDHVYSVYCNDKLKEIFDLTSQEFGCLPQTTPSNSTSHESSTKPTSTTTKTFANVLQKKL